MADCLFIVIPAQAEGQSHWSRHGSRIKSGMTLLEPIR